MASPLAWFRKNEKAMLGFFGVLLMIAFTFSLGSGVDPLVQYFSGGGGGRAARHAVVARFNGGKLDESDFQVMRYNRARLATFVRQAFQTAIQQGGTPSAPPIPLDDSDQSLVESYLLAQRAKDMGLVVSDEAAREYLSAFTGNVLSGPQLVSILRASTNRQMTQVQMLDILRDELLAQKVRLMATTGVFPRSPVTAWDFFCRLHRRVKAELMPIEVAGFVDEIPEPSAEELQAFYDKYKDRYDQPNSPEPGFKRRRQMDFQFARADFNVFLESELAEISDQEIQDHYQQHKEDYRRTPSDTSAPKASDLDLNAPKAPSEQTPANDSGAAPAPVNPTPPEGSVGPSAQPPAAEAKPEPVTEPQPANELKPANKPEPTAETEPATEPQPASKPQPATEPDSSDKNPVKDMEQPENKEQAENQEQPETKDQPESKEQAEDKEPLEGKEQAEDKESLESKEQAEGDDQSDGQTEQESDDPPTEAPTPAGPDEDETQGNDSLSLFSVSSEEDRLSQPSSDAETSAPETVTSDKSLPTEPGSAAQAEAAPPAEKEVTPAADSPAAESAEPAGPSPEYQPLEEVRDTIRRELAMPRAQKKRDEALSAVRNLVEQYYRKRLVWQLTIDEQPDAAEPTPPDFSSLTDQYPGLTFGATGLVDRVTVQQQEIGKTYELGYSGQPIPFASVAFGEKVDSYKARIFPQQAFRDVKFLFWNTEEKPAFVPELSSIRDEVVRAWKMQDDKAVKLAVEAARQVAGQVRESGKALAQVAADRPGREVIETDEVSWMTTGSLPANSSRGAYLSAIPEVQGAGRELRETMFRLPVGQVGVARNQPHTLVYVIRVLAESPDQKTLRDQFLTTGVTGPVQYLAQSENEWILGQWYKGLLDEIGFQWIRDPQGPSQSQ